MNRDLKKIIMMLAMSLICVSAFTMHVEAKSGSIKVTAPSGKTVKVAKGKKVKLKTKVKKLKNKKVTYKSLKSSIAKVSASGVVSGIKAGKTKITVISKADKKIKKTVKVIVYKKAVKKIKLSATKKTLTKGQQFTLKADVLPKKKTCKTLKFSSSNKKVVTVNKKGGVKAVGVGSAYVVVKATDGSNKKSVCKINVVDSKKKISIKSLKVRYAKSLEVELTSPKKLELEDFKVYFKVLSSDSYLRELNVEEVHTQDNIHYEVVINGYLSYSTYVKVQIKSLTGINYKEILVDKRYPVYSYDYYLGENVLLDGNVHNVYYAGKIGTHISETVFYKSKFAVYAAPLTFKVSNLPKGLNVNYSSSGNPVIFGYCATKLNGHRTVITATDANGKKFYEYMYFYIGDEDVAYAKAPDATRLAYVPGENTTLRYTPTVYISDVDNSTGAQNLYGRCTDFEAAGLPENVKITSSGELNVIDRDKEVKPGTYNILITAITPSGKDIIIRYKLTLIKGIVISGKITSANGIPESKCSLCIKSRIDKDEYYYCVYVNGDENGNYRIRVIPGFYNINANQFYNSYQVDFRKSQTYNIVSNYYCVQFTNKLFKDQSAVYYDSGMDLYSREKDGSLNSYAYWNYYYNYGDKETFVVYGYLKKGESYLLSPYSYYNFTINGEKYILVSKDFVFTGQKTINIELKKVVEN